MSLDEFAVTGKIVDGANSTVLQAVRMQDGLHVVLKCYDGTAVAPGMFLKTPSECDEPYLKEAHFLRKARNVSGCVKMIDYFHDKCQDKYVIVLEDLHFLGFTELTEEIVKDDGFLTESSIGWILREIILTLQQIHDLNVLHCDIKPDNIFINRHERRIKLLDFSIASEISPQDLPTADTKSILCTPEYAPPEVLLYQRTWTPAGETWSLGVTAFVLLCKKFPFSDPFTSYYAQPAYPEDYYSQYGRDVGKQSLYANESVVKPKPSNTRLSLKAKDFLTSCLHKKPHCRPNFQRLLLHPFLAADSSLRIYLSVNSFSFDNPGRISAQAF